MVNRQAIVQGNAAHMLIIHTHLHEAGQLLLRSCAVICMLQDRLY